LITTKGGLEVMIEINSGSSPFRQKKKKRGRKGKKNPLRDQVG